MKLMDELRGQKVGDRGDVLNLMVFVGKWSVTGFYSLQLIPHTGR